MGKDKDAKPCLDFVKHKMRMGDFEYFELNEDDIKNIQECLKTAKDTDSSGKTQFPDFVSTNGFIEHFQVTSGKFYEKKGHKNKQDISVAQANNIDYLQNHVVEKSSMTIINRCDESLTNLHKSLFSAWKKHIDHLNRYTGNKHISCFLIGSDDIMTVHIQPKDENIQDALFPDKSHCVLMYDSELLDYMCEYIGIIDYCIFCSGLESVGVLKLSNIPEIKKQLSNYDIYILPCVSQTIVGTMRLI